MEISGSLSKNYCENCIWTYGKRTEMKPVYLQKYSALQWNQRYPGMFFLDSQIACWASLSHPTPEHLYIFQRVKKKEKLREGNRKEIRKGENKIYQGILKIGGKIHTQRWKMMSFSKLFKNSNPSNCLDLLLQGKVRNIPNTEERTKAFSTYFCSIFGEK